MCAELLDKIELQPLNTNIWIFCSLKCQIGFFWHALSIPRQRGQVGVEALLFVRKTTCLLLIRPSVFLSHPSRDNCVGGSAPTYRWGSKTYLWKFDFPQLRVAYFSFLIPFLWNVTKKLSCCCRYTSLLLVESRVVICCLFFRPLPNNPRENFPLSHPPLRSWTFRTKKWRRRAANEVWTRRRSGKREEGGKRGGRSTWHLSKGKEGRYRRGGGGALLDWGQPNGVLTCTDKIAVCEREEFP